MVASVYIFASILLHSYRFGQHFCISECHYSIELSETPAMVLSSKPLLSVYVSAMGTDANWKLFTAFNAALLE